MVVGMNCCNANGQCTQGRDCPVRKKRAQETYKEFYEMNLNPYDDVTETIKALIAVIAVTAALTLLAFLVWGK
jgi:hypothetical protein